MIKGRNMSVKVNVKTNPFRQCCACLCAAEVSDLMVGGCNPSLDYGLWMGACRQLHTASGGAARREK